MKELWQMRCAPEDRQGSKHTASYKEAAELAVARLD